MGNCFGKTPKDNARNGSGAASAQKSRSLPPAANSSMKMFECLLDNVTDPVLAQVVKPKMRYEVSFFELLDYLVAILTTSTQRDKCI